jgi:hypothetical protein
MLNNVVTTGVRKKITQPGCHKGLGANPKSGAKPKTKKIATDINGHIAIILFLRLIKIKSSLCDDYIIFLPF